MLGQRHITNIRLAGYMIFLEQCQCLVEDVAASARKAAHGALLLSIGNQCVFVMHVHLVFVAKYRRDVFTLDILDDLRPLFSRLCADFEAEDHVHLLVTALLTPP